MRRLTLVLNLLVFYLFQTGCTAPESLVCDDGSVCPASAVCIEGGGCADKASLIACEGFGEDDGCSTASLPEGVCRSGLCVSANCGDGFINPGEGCDDGNTVGGDGCSSRCDKIEICGDVIVDEGEACDDGNSNAVDGCDACGINEWLVSTKIGGAESGALVRPGGVVKDPEGNIYVSLPSEERVVRIDAQSGTVTTVAGTGERGFSGDGGPATSAKLNGPRQLALDGFGNLFIVDDFSNLVRRVDAQSGLMTTVAGTVDSSAPSADGGLAASTELQPKDIAIDGLGNLYIAESSRIRRVDSNTGLVSTVAGGGSMGDGALATEASLDGASGIFLDENRNLYIAESNAQRVRRVDGESGVISAVAGNGTGGFFGGFSGDGGPATEASLGRPTDIVVSANGDLYIIDQENYRIRRVDGASGIITTFAGNGTQTGQAGLGGPADEATLTFPYAMFVDENLDVYVAGSVLYRIDGRTDIISSVSGDTDNEGRSALSVDFDGPKSIVSDPSGNIYVLESDAGLLRRIDAQTGLVSVIAGNGEQGVLGDEGPAVAATLNRPSDLAIDKLGNLYIADTQNYRLRRVDAATGIITTIAGNGVSQFSGDGAPAVDASLAYPTSVAVDADFNVYIGDGGASNRIRRIDGQSNLIETFAGNGLSGFSGDGGPATAASLRYSQGGMTVDTQGNLYFTDTNNRRVRRVDNESRIISTVTGARFDSPIDVAVDAGGNVFVAEMPASFSIQGRRVRRVDSESGAVTTVAGIGSSGQEFGEFLGDGGLATLADLDRPESIAFDGQDNLYIADTRTFSYEQGYFGTKDTIRRVDADTGIIRAIAGEVGPTGMGAAAVAKLADPVALALSGGAILVAGGVSGTVQKFQDERARVVAGRYSQFFATGNLARYRGDDFGAIGGIAVDEAAKLVYVTQPDEHRIQVITMVDEDAPWTWTIDQLAGDGISGFSDGVSSDARFRSPRGLLLRDGMLYVADSGNHVVRAIHLASSTVSTVAGTPRVRGFFGDEGLATSALLFSPSALTQCPNGDMFIADTGNHRIRRLDGASGLVTTVLGDGTGASSGQGAPANNFPVNAPLGLACDASGNVFATSTDSVRLLPSDATGLVDGTGGVRTIYGESPRTAFPETVTRCLTGIASLDATHVTLADSCSGVLVELELSDPQF